MLREADRYHPSVYRRQGDGVEEGSPPSLVDVARQAIVGYLG